MKMRTVIVWSVLGVASLAIARAACAQETGNGSYLKQAQGGDPNVPYEARRPTAGTQTSDGALRAQVMRKLQSQFNEADVRQKGLLTQEEARTAGLGFVADNFKQIDTYRTGRVSFADVRRFMQLQNARQK